MRAPISVVIPTLNAAGELPETLGRLALGLDVVREVIVSDGGSTDATRAIAEEAGAAVVEGPPGRGGQLRRGAEAAGGPWLLFLHADTHLPDGWEDAARAHMRSDVAGWFRLAFRAEGLGARWTAGWANARSRMGLPYGDQGLLIPRALYDAVGGFDDVPLMEDVRMARALRGRMAPIGATVTTSAARYERRGWLRQGARNLGTLARHLAGASPEALAARYRR